VDSYKSLGAWEVAHQLVIQTLTVLDGHPSGPRTWAPFDQLRRAAVSVEANIVEGYAAGTGPLFRRHLRIAIGSAAECECLINIAAERHYLTGTDVSSLEELASATIAVLYGLIRSPRLLHFSAHRSQRTAPSSQLTAPRSQRPAPSSQRP